MFHNLIIIDQFYESFTYGDFLDEGRIWINNNTLGIGSVSTTKKVIPDSAYIWHYIWAKIFYLLNIDNEKLFFRAKIIHIIQIYITFFSLYYFSNVVIRNIFEDIKLINLKYLSLWSILIWLTIFATFSEVYHQIWLLWYSINYQITLPLFWYMTGLTIVLILEKSSSIQKIFITLQILLLSFFILQVHSMEFMYYLMHLCILSLIFIDKVYFFIKKYFYIFITIVLGIGYFIKHYQPEHSQIFNYLSWGKLPVLYDKIMYAGALLGGGYNRAFASINELMYFTGIISIPFVLYVVFQYYYKKQQNINLRMLLFVGVTSLFVLIPLYQFTGGLFGIITKTMVVNRLYYSASIFIVLPIVVYYLAQNYQLKLRYINLILALSLISVYSVSKYTNVMNHNYYKNIYSIKNSFNEGKIGFNLSQNQIDTVGKIIEKYEQNNKTDKEIKFYVRADIAFVIKYIYHKDVYWEGRSKNPDYIKLYKKNKNRKNYRHILFKIPKDFPSYRPFS